MPRPTAAAPIPRDVAELAATGANPVVVVLGWVETKAFMEGSMSCEMIVMEAMSVSGTCRA